MFKLLALLVVISVCVAFGGAEPGLGYGYGSGYGHGYGGYGGLWGAGHLGHGAWSQAQAYPSGVSHQNLVVAHPKAYGLYGNYRHWANFPYGYGGHYGYGHY